MIDSTTVTIASFCVGFFLGWNKQKIKPWTKQLITNYKKNQDTKKNPPKIETTEKKE